MQHYLVNSITNHHAQFSSSDEHHIRHVMRYKTGDPVIVIFDNQRFEAEMIVTNEQLSARIVSTLESPVKQHTVTLIYGLPRSEKWELVLQKATELGVDRVIPFQSSKSLVRIDRSSEPSKQERWAKIVKEAVEQCERSTIPVIEPIRRSLDFDDVQADLKLFALERTPITRTLAQRLSTIPSSVVVVVGPEAGWTKQEADYFASKGYQLTSLGNDILRSETAALYMLAAIKLLGETND